MLDVHVCEPAHLVWELAAVWLSLYNTKEQWDANTASMAGKFSATGLPELRKKKTCGSSVLLLVELTCSFLRL